jgi:hypothetical protein
MEHVKMIEKRIGVDVGYHSSNIDPIDREGCVGKSGIDKSYTFEMVLKLAYKIENKPNIIIKAGPNTKWYLKQCPKELIGFHHEKQKWRDISRCIMYIIDWDQEFEQSEHNEEGQINLQRIVDSSDEENIELFNQREEAEPNVSSTSIEEDDEELLEAKRQMAIFQRVIAEKEKQKQVKQQVSKSSIYKDELSAKIRSREFDELQAVDARIQEALRQIQVWEQDKVVIRQQVEQKLQDLDDASAEQVVEIYNQEQDKKKPMAKSSKKATTLADDDDGSEGTTKDKRGRSKIERNLDKTFENCGIIVITEDYEGAKARITLTRNPLQPTWKQRCLGQSRWRCGE